MRYLMAKMNERTTQNIIECAKQEFFQYGYKKATLVSICNKAGITTGAFYKRFINKEDLFQTIVAPTVRELIDRLEKSKSLGNGLIMPEWSYIFIYSHRDVFQILVRCNETPFYNIFIRKCTDLIAQTIQMKYSIEPHFYPSISSIIKSYLLAFFEIIQYNSEFKTTQHYIKLLESFYSINSLHKLQDINEEVIPSDE